MPAWRQGIAVGEWREMSGTALSSAPMSVQTYPTLGVEGPTAKVTQWIGFAIDSRDSSVYSVANGGHHAYAGNEVNRIRLSDSKPAWTEVRASTPASQVIDSSAYYADGRPTSRHTYYGSIINEKLNRAMLINGSQYGNGYGISTVDGFNLSTNDWDAARTYASTPSALTQVMGAAMALHKTTGDIYAFGWSTMHRWNAATNTWTSKDTAFNGQSAASAVDTARNRILLLGGYGNIQAIYDIATGTMQSVSLSGPEAGSVGGQNNALVYDPLQDAFLLRKDGAGADIYRINAQTLSVDKQPTSAAGSQIPATTNGVWGKFMYVPALKGVVYLPAYSGNIWFLRTY
jgi:hypothetical protein